jgi:hypothetical protein
MDEEDIHAFAQARLAKATEQRYSIATLPFDLRVTSFKRNTHVNQTEQFKIVMALI